MTIGALLAQRAGVQALRHARVAGDPVAEILHAATGAEGGVRVVAIEPTHRDARAASIAAVERQGYLAVPSGSSYWAAADRVVLHRHVFLWFDSTSERRTAIRWIRALAQASPRRHLIVWPNDSSPDSPGSVDTTATRRDGEDAAASRLARAATHMRRGRERAGEQWLAAAAAAATRRRDYASAAAVGLELATRLVQRAAWSEASARLRVLMQVRDLEWFRYAEVAALWADVVIGRGELRCARDWLAGLTAEAVVRGVAEPASIRARLAEVDFWLKGRAVPERHEESLSADEIGWTALSAWCDGNVAATAAAAAALARRSSSEGTAAFWLACLQLLMTADPLLAAARAREFEARLVSTRLSARRRALGCILCARAMWVGGEPARARALLAGLAGRGPEADAADRLRALWRHSRTGAESAAVTGASHGRRPAAGVVALTTERVPMQIMEGLCRLLELIEDSSDEGVALAAACAWVCRHGGTEAIAIVSADGAQMVAGHGWRSSDLAGEIAEALRGGGVTAPVRYAGVVVGQVVARGRATDTALVHTVRALAVVAGTAVRARLDALALVAQERQAVPELIGKSPGMADVRASIARAATTTFPVLVEGESGTGKELVARALHRLSPRRDHRFLAVNCAALTDELVETELFGHTRGAFTGAVGSRAGLFEEASGGTLFLDEVSELSPRAQAKLLRVLQEREVRRVGESAARRVDVRVIAATNLPLSSAVAAGRFRDDLRFRLAVIRVRLPPLRERLEDLSLLTHVFWRRAMDETGKRAVLAPDALARLSRHSWPGNVRELQNVVSGLAVAAPARGRVGERHVALTLAQDDPIEQPPAEPLDVARRRCERRVVAAALARHAGRRPPAAMDLGLTRQGLAKVLRRLGLEHDDTTEGVA